MIDAECYIGFCGKAGVGKTTACDILRDIHKGSSIVLPWAHELKRIAKEEFGWDGEKDEKGRKLLQTLGTECGRMYGGKLFWVNKWQQKVDDFLEKIMGPVLVLNDDTRFDSEAKRIKDNGGTMIKLFGRSIDLCANSGHSSEIGISEEYIDHRLDNSGPMGDLQEKLTQFYQHLMENPDE